jgi:hypothetical protein
MCPNTAGQARPSLKEHTMPDRHQIEFVISEMKIGRWIISTMQAWQLDADTVVDISDKMHTIKLLIVK